MRGVCAKIQIFQLGFLSFRSKMGGGKLVPEKSWWGKKLVHLEELYLWSAN